MAQINQTITVSLARLTIKAKLPRAYGLRMWITTRLLTVTGWIAPHDIEVEIVDAVHIEPLVPIA